MNSDSPIILCHKNPNDKGKYQVAGFIKNIDPPYVLHTLGSSEIIYSLDDYIIYRPYITPITTLGALLIQIIEKHHNHPTYTGVR